MRKFFTRLLLMVTLFSVISLVSLAQSWTSPKLTPVDGACTVLETGQTFTIDFGEAVMPIKGGKISLNFRDGTQLYPIQFNWDGTNPPAPWVYTSSITPWGTVTFSGNKVIIDFKTTGIYALTEKENYYITVHPNSIKRVSTSAVFAGIGGTYPANGTLTCDNDAGYGWDFTVRDFTLPTFSKFRPLDEAKDVSPAFISGVGIKILFNEKMQWAPGYFDVNNNWIPAKSFASLVPGDIALYTTTDPILGQYGGDAIFLKPASVDILSAGATADSIVIKWPGLLPSLTNMYVRIAKNLFAEAQVCTSCPGQVAPKMWGGINTNGTGPDGIPSPAVPWNFTTKDTRPPVVTITRGSCFQNSNFTITIDEGSIVTAGTMVPLNNANVDAFVTFSGGAFDATVVNNPGSTVITIDPVNNLVSGATTTIALLGDALWDASQNYVPAKTASFTNGDYLPPVFSKLQSTNPVGTSFDILANVNEKVTVYYVVVKKSDVLKSSVEYYKPTMKQIVDSLGIVWNTNGDPDNDNIPDVDLYNDQSFPLDSFCFVKTGTNPEKKQIHIWAAGSFPINVTGTDMLERVLDLPRTNGMDYIVYAYAFDNSACGPYNWTDLTSVTQGYVTGLLSFPATTNDVLPPIPTISAAYSTQWCNESHLAHTIYKNGPIYITFNEPIRLADGSPITPASLENIIELRDNGILVGINTVTSGYNATDKKITIYPDSAFKSGSTVFVKLLSNKVEDLVGIERNVPVSKEFCVEVYCEPLISWTADKYDMQLNQVLHNYDNEVEEKGTIRVVFDMKVYAPADNEVPAGSLTQITNTPGLINSVSNFIKIGESTTQYGLYSIIYDNGNLVNFDVTLNDYSGDSTVITIKPKGTYEFGSEMWYNIEVEGTLQSEERYTLNGEECYDQETDITFQVTDHQPPTVTFYEGNASTQVMYRKLNNCVSCNTPTTNVDKTYRIGVAISEWIKLGFDGMPGVLEPTETIHDANAMRRYFSLTKCDGTAIKFDVEDFSIDATGDTAFMFIDPYDYPTAGTETPNFVAGETYTVKFISNAQEPDYGPGAFADDHGNIMEPGESCFKIFVEPVPVVCFNNTTFTQLSTGICNGVIADPSTFSVSLNFGKAMMFNTGSDPALAVYASDKSNVVFGTNFANLDISNDAKTFALNSTNNDDAGNPLLFVDGQKYYIAVYKEVFKTIDTGTDCKWPPVNPKAVLNIGNWVIVDSIMTVDSTPPDLVSKTEGPGIPITSNLTMTWTERVIPVAGQVVNIYELGTNTQIASVNVAGSNNDNNTTIVLQNSLFNTFLVYGRTYYAQFNAGLVKDLCDNLSVVNIPVQDKTSWVFTIEPDPAPGFISCAQSLTSGFTPEDNSFITNLQPTFKIRFTEPVVPVADKKIDLYETLPTIATAIKGNWNATAMTANSTKTEYSIPFSAITSLTGTLIYGNCYHINIQGGAFKEVAGVQVTDRLVSFPTENAGDVTTCTWDFCVEDVIAPTVTFWPLNNVPLAQKENIPLNAYLFVQLSEPVHFDAGWAITEVNAKNSFRLEKLKSLYNGTTCLFDTCWELIDFRLDAVGTDADKTRFMFTPLDPAAPDFGTTTNPTMDDDSWYKLIIIQPNTAGYFLEDAAGNHLVADSTYFHTEDILCPVMSSVLTNPVAANSFTLNLTLDEAGSIDYKVVKKGAGSSGTAVASGTVTDISSPFNYSIAISGIDASTANGYEYDVWVTRRDNEIDRFATDAQILAEWPYTQIPSWGLETIRIKDLRPAPNQCSATLAITAKLCDDDKPVIVAQYPLPGADNIPVGDNIWFQLNEPIEVEAILEVDGLDHDSIVLRDYENNLAIPAVITEIAGSKKVQINPNSNLLDEHRYYIEIERHAVRDSLLGCNNKYNYLDELIGKSWWFKTKDNTPPAIVCGSLSPSGNCVDKNADLVITVTDGNAVTTNPANVPFIDIYEVGSSIPHERISTAGIVPVVNGNSYTFTFPTAYFYLSGKCYTAAIPAQLFKDLAVNKSVAPGCSWNFCARDYEAPIASWKVVEDFSYMYIATSDPLYEREYRHGDAGGTLTGIPTSSFFYVKFHEPVQVLDTLGTDTWRALDSAASFNLDLLARAIKVTNVTTGQVLTYNIGYYILNDFWHPRDRFKVIITDDFSHIGYSGALQWSGSYTYPFGSMMSNATYTIELKKNWISDLPSCSAQRIITDDVLLVTASTRNDVPPTLTVKDANGAIICDNSCNEDWTLLKWWSNMTQPNNWSDNCCDNPSDSVWWNWQPEWPVDTMCNVCVAPSDHLTLEFDKAVVKTPVELINTEPFWWEGHGVQWWTEANLGLWPKDFADPSDPDFTSRFIKFQRSDGDGGWVDVVLDSAAVIDNRIIELYWGGTLLSEGIYAITFAPYTVKDIIRIPQGNEFLGLTCTFKVVDHNKPDFVSPEYIGQTVPCSGQWDPYPTDVDTDTQLAMLFNEPVQPGLPGTKLIIRRENGQQQQIIDVSQITIDEQDSIGGVPNPWYLRRVFINNGNFEENTLYYVEVQPKFIADRASCGLNYWDGIDPEDSEPGWQALIPTFEWVFKTGDNTPPLPILLIPNRRNDVSRETDLTIIFDENVFTDCVCLEEEPIENPSMMKGAPMTWTDYMIGKGFYIYADNGSTPSVEFGNIVEFIPFWIAPGLMNPQIKITGTDIYNGLTSDKVVIDPYTVFQKNMTYYVRVSDSIFCDGFKNFWDGIGDSTTWKFTITNDVAPEISWTSPAYEKMSPTVPPYPQTVAAQPNGFAVTDLKMAFVDEDTKLPLMVKPGAGNIKIFEYIYNPLTFSYEEKLWKTISITDPSVIFKNDTVIVKNVTLLDDVNLQNCISPRMYYVTVDPGAVTNGYPGSLTYWEGFNDAFDWRFYTAPDNTFMTPYTIVKPLGTNLTIPGASTLQISFAENIEAIPATTAKVKIYKAAGDVLVDQFTVVPANISGNTLTLVTTQLVDETAYYVLIDMGAVGDTSTCSTPFPGILAKTVWTFSTGDNTAPVPVLAAQLGTCETPCVIVGFTFNETLGVTPGAGKINLLKNGVVFASQLATMGANMNSITATFCGLPDLTVFTIALEADVVKDNGNNHISNVAVANPAWTFTTGDNTAPVITEWAPVVLNAEPAVTLVVKASEAVDPVLGKKLTLTHGATVQTFDVTSMTSTDGGIHYSLSVSGLLDATTYNVNIEAGAFIDRGCHHLATAATTTWSLTTDDNTPPIVTPYKPVQDEVLSTYIGMGISFTLSEPVKAGTGNITITRGTNVLSLPVGGDKVVIDGTRVTLVLTDMLYFGLVAVNVPAGAFVDMAVNPNGNPSRTWTFWITDTGIADNCMTIIDPEDGEQGVLRNVVLTMEFCERMAPGDPAKLLRVYDILEITGGLAINDLKFSTPVIAGMIHGTRIEVPVSGLKDKTGYIVLIDEDAIRDEAGHPFIGIPEPFIWNYTTGDNTPPTVVLVPVPPAGLTNNLNLFVVNAVFSEKVVGAIEKIVVTGAVSKTITTTDNITFAIAIDALDKASVTITVPVTITDVLDAKGYGNPLAAQVQGTYVVGDNTQPTVAITSQPADKTNTPRTFNVVLTFSEKVSGVAAALAGSTGMTGVTSTDDIVYTVAMAGADETQVKLVLNKTLVKDVSVNQNVLKDGLSETYTVGDWAAPTAVVDPAAKTDIRDAVFNVKVTFSEDVIVPATGGFVVTGGTLGTPTNLGLVWTLPITAVDGANVKLELNSTITDDSKNKNPLAYAAYNYTFGDRTRPTVKVFKPSAKDTVNVFDVIVTFSEQVTGVDLTTVTLKGRKPAISLREVVAGLAYEANISGADGDTLTLAFSDAIKDLAGNKLVPASFVYTIADTKPPTVVATPPSGLNLLNKNTVLLDFSENVNNVLTGVTVTGATTWAVTLVKDLQYKVTFEAVDLALVKINVGASIVDWKGNAMVPVSFMYEIGDHVAPTVVAVPASNTNAPNKWDVVLTFSEPVHIPDGSITVTGAESYTLDATSHTVSINAKDGAVVKLSLSSAIIDKSLNANPLVAVSYTYTVGDNTAPKVTAVGPVPADNTLNDFNVTLTFTEEVTGVSAGLAGSTGVTGVTPSADGKTYVVAMHGADLAKLKLVLDKTLVKDLSVNKNQLEAGLDLAYTVGDHVAPTATIVPATADKAKNKFNVDVTFSEAVNVPAGAISVTGGTGTVTNVGNVYTVAIEAVDLAVVKLKLTDAITDKSLNANKYAGSENTYTVGDNTAPKVTLNPATGTNMANTFAVLITFSEKVTGVDASSITVSGTGATVALVTVVDGLGYQATINAPDKTVVTLTVSDAIKDLAGNALVKTTGTYTVGDHVAPTLVSAVPASGADNQKNTTVITLTFSEDVTGVPAAISVSVGTVTVTATSATVYKATITAPDLTTVVMTISNAVADLAGNKFAGVKLDYKVGDNTAPKLLTWTPNNVTTEDNHPVFIMTFDENVVAGPGSLYVYQPGVSGAFITVPVTASMISGKIVTVVYNASTNGALDKNTKYYVLVDADAVKDANGNKFAGVTDSKTWTFTTGPKFATSATDLSSIEFKVYPNPFNEYLNVQNNDKLTRLTITNVVGQRVMDVLYPERVIRTQNLVSGVYVITLFTQDGIAKSERIVKR